MKSREYCKAMRYLLSLFIALLSSVSLHAQSARDSIAIYGKVMDSFTHEMLKRVRITIMRADSTVIAEYNTDKEYRFGGYRHNFDAAGYIYIPRIDCIFRFEKEGYFTQYLNLYKHELGRRETRRSLGEIFLKKIAKRREVELGEAQVIASKIRMVFKGDTLVYNADAFQLAEGSMLDGLFKLLPGFQLRNGQIFVNGQHVSSLLVNGEHFFRGDPRVALENLPAYMVNKVKVYRKEHAWSHITNGKKSKEELPLVVDVNLKREYAIGWVGNAGVGYGTEERYLGRIFGLRFTDHSRLALYSNLNNTNDTQEPGTSGDWIERGTSEGLTEMQTVGFEFLVKGSKDTWKYVGHAKLYHRNLHNEGISSSETFQPTLPNSTFSRMRQESESHQWQIQTEQQYEVNRANYFHQIFGSLSYWHHRTNAWQQSADFSDDPMDSYRAASLDSLFSSASERLKKLLINMQRSQQQNSENLWSGRLSVSSLIKIPHTPDYLRLSFNADGTHQNGNAFSNNYLRYGQSTVNSVSAEHQLRYTATPIWKLNANLQARYSWRLDWTYFSPYLSINNSFHDGKRSSYRFDRLGADAPPFGVLPSTVAALLQTLDAPNSYREKSNVLNVRLGTEWIIWLGGKWPSHNIRLEPILQWQSDFLTYHRDALNATPHRGHLLFIPKISWGFDDCRFNYEIHSELPSLLSQLDYIDNADLLNLYSGNPDLKRCIKHVMRFYRGWNNFQKGRHIKVSAQWSVTQNAIAHGQIYDTKTGEAYLHATQCDRQLGCFFRLCGKYTFGCEATVSFFY